MAAGPENQTGHICIKRQTLYHVAVQLQLNRSDASMSDEDKCLLDMWEAEGDAYQAQHNPAGIDVDTDLDDSDTEIDSAIDNGFESDSDEDDDDYHSDDECNDDDDIEYDSDCDEHEQSDSDSGVDSESDDNSCDSESDDDNCDSESDDDSCDSESDDNSSDENSDSDMDSDNCDFCVLERRIKPIRRRKWVARPIRIQLLKRSTLLGSSGDHVCCHHRCCEDWDWVRNYDVYADFDD